MFFMDVTWVIYCHTHNDSNRHYVGLTKKTLLHRWNRHVYDATRCRFKHNHFHSAIRKYGKDAFSHEVLEICSTVEEANAAEEKWIKHFDSTDPKKGFNLANGGTHVPHKVSNAYRSDPEYLIKRSKASKKRWKDPKYRSLVLRTTQEALRTSEVRQKLSKSVSKLWQDPEYRKVASAPFKELAKDPKHLQRLSERWDDPEFREKCSVGTKAHIEKQSNKTHCKRGHEFTAENVVLSKDGHRECKICNYARKRAAKTHCPKGHKYSEDNTTINSSGRHICRTCLESSKIIKPCSKCGGPKSQQSSGKWRCRPCTNGRILNWKKSKVDQMGFLI